MRKFDLTFPQVLEQLSKDPKKWFQGENFKSGVVMKAADHGSIITETYYEDKFSTDVYSYPLSTRTIHQKFREVFNQKELFEKE